MVNSVNIESGGFTNKAPAMKLINTANALAQLQQSPSALTTQPTQQRTGLSGVDTYTPQPTTPGDSGSGYDNSVGNLTSLLQNQQSLTAQVNLAAAQRAAQAHLETSAGGGGSYAGPVASQPAGSHQLQSWVDQALNILHLSNRFAPGVENIIMHESSGNPNSINRWDSNAQAGHPSQGLMQTIPGTFAEYALPGYNKNIDDPVSNIIAGVRYAISRYGKGMVLAGGRNNSADQYEGY